MKTNNKKKKTKQYLQKNRLREELKGRFQNSFSGFLRVCVVGVLVLLQIIVIVLLPYWLHGLSIYFYLIMEVLSFLVIFGLVNDNRSQSYKLAWLCIMLLLPISGHIMYALWGKKIGRAHV